MKPKRTILCVDDNEQSLSYRKIMLETRGYRVASYSRGEEALDRFKQGGIDLVVTDMAMPGLDGPQLIAASRICRPTFRQSSFRARPASTITNRKPTCSWPGACMRPLICWNESVCFWCASADPSECNRGCNCLSGKE